jgi:hypothetical protein
VILGTEVVIDLSLLDEREKSLSRGLVLKDRLFHQAYEAIGDLLAARRIRPVNAEKISELSLTA